jgi:hypothetical protein
MTLIQSEKNGHYLTFDEEKHRYALDGERVPGPTTFIKNGYPESANLTSWKIGQGSAYVSKLLQRVGREKPIKLKEKTNAEIIKRSKTAYVKTSMEAAAIGSIVHDYAYLTELGRTREALQMLSEYEGTEQWERINNGVNKFTAWKKENGDEMVSSEAIVASVKYRYGGKFDRLASRNGVLILSDFKTSNGIYLDQFIQLAAYRVAIREWLSLDVEALEILRFGKEDGEFHTLLIDDENEVEELTRQAVRCRETYEFTKWNNDKRFKFGGKSA